MTDPSSLFPPGQPPEAAPRSARDIVAVLYRQAGLVALCALAGLAAAVLLYAKQPRVYASSAKVWVQTEQQGSPSFLSGIAAYRETPYPDPVNRKIETEIELMLTRTSAQAVVERLGIRDEQLAHGSFARIKADLAGHATEAAGPEAAASAAANGGRARTVDLFLDGISVEPLRSKTADTSSNVLEVRFECADRALAPVALQAFLDNYFQLGAQQNRRLGETTSRLLETKLAQARDELRQAEDRIVALQVQSGARRGTTELPGAEAGSGAGRSGGVSSGSSAVGTGGAGGVGDAGSAAADAGADAASTGHGTNPVVASLKARTLELQQRLDEARQLYTEDTETVRTLRAQLAVAQQRLASTVRDNARTEAQLQRLERGREMAQERFVELQHKLDQIDLYLRLNPTEAESRVLIDPPDHPGSAEGHKKIAVALLGPLAGLLLGLLLAGLRELGGERMRSPREVEWALGVPVLGALPTLSAKARAAYIGTSPANPSDDDASAA